MSLTRRQLLSLSGRSLLTVSLMGTMQKTGLATDEGNANVEAWLSRLREAGRQLGSGRISGLQWQEQMDRILDSVKLASLLKYIDFDRMHRDLTSRDLGTRGEICVPVDVGVPARQTEAGVPEESRLLITKVAHVRKGRSIPPHGHSNMVSAFLCISGRFDVRLFDRLEEREDSMVVR